LNGYTLRSSLPLSRGIARHGSSTDCEDASPQSSSVSIVSRSRSSVSRNVGTVLRTRSTTPLSESVCSADRTSSTSVCIPAACTS